MDLIMSLISYYENSLFGAVKLTKNAPPDKYSYSGYGTGFDACGFFIVSV